METQPDTLFSSNINVLSEIHPQSFFVIPRVVLQMCSHNLYAIVIIGQNKNLTFYFIAWS